MTQEQKPQPKIMTKPLPQILDELEDYIKEAKQAAQDARDAAEQAKQSGEDAAAAAKKAADAAVAAVREEAARTAAALQKQIDQLAAEIAIIKGTAINEAAAIDEAFLAAKEKHATMSPHLDK